jgi:hypothetical protein
MIDTNKQKRRDRKPAKIPRVTLNGASLNGKH